MPESTVRKEEKRSAGVINLHFLKEIFIDSVVQMVKTLFKKRPGVIKILLFLQLIR